jgi:hypothetical protein
MSQLFSIDHKGELIIFADTWQIHARPDRTGPVERAVKAGQIVWQSSGNTITLRLRPSMVTASALARIGTWLDSAGQQRLHITYWADGNWHHQIFGSPSEALKRIEALVSRFGGGRYGNMLRNSGPSTRSGHLKFKKVMSLWQEHKTRFSPDHLFPLLHQDMKGHVTLLEAVASGEFRIARPGDALTVGARQWAFGNPNSAVTTLPFYSEPIFHGFYEADAKREPVSDEIDGLFIWPRQTPVRVSYHRLVLPFASRTKRWILSAVIPDNTINLLP